MFDFFFWKIAFVVGLEFREKNEWTQIPLGSRRRGKEKEGMKTSIGRESSFIEPPLAAFFWILPGSFESSISTSSSWMTGSDDEPFWSFWSGLRDTPSATPTYRISPCLEKGGKAWLDRKKKKRKESKKARGNENGWKSGTWYSLIGG